MLKANRIFSSKEKTTSEEPDIDSNEALPNSMIIDRSSQKRRVEQGDPRLATKRHKSSPQKSKGNKAEKQDNQSDNNSSLSNLF